MADYKVNRFLGGLAFVNVLLLDQLSKFWITSLLAPGETKAFCPCINFVLVFNKGISFGLLNQGKPWQFIVIGMAILLISLWVLRQYWYAERGAQSFCLGMILGGAVGNLLDRVFRSAVVDFIDLYVENFSLPFLQQNHWPAFNVADSAIVVGVFLLFFLYRNKEKKKKGKEPAG
ncbi:lipoprotein signal peptidase [Alphaproteobacteria bacterium]|nr:lipoprotein signal peptidase [Alphaproteobacteria bacterium]GHS96179.1 lipoprotein signal peptidase [Alphaproteobacteria bacterium]